MIKINLDVRSDVVQHYRDMSETICRMRRKSEMGSAIYACEKRYDRLQTLDEESMR